jgi:16S rRNA (guanine1207-N2)-methyltransferase
MEQNNLNNITLFTEAYIPEKNYYDTIIIQAPRDMDHELLQDLIQNSYLHLNKNGRVLILHQGKLEFITGQLKSLFGGYTNLMDKKQVQIEIAKKKEGAPKLKSFSAEFKLTRHLKEPITLTSIPGVFAHRRVDQGAQALIENVEILPGQKILDMGCGCGSIGIAISKDISGTEVHFVDSSARAIFSTEQNCQSIGLKNYHLHSSDIGIIKENYFDIFNGNQPYFSDYKIAEMFLESANRSLKINGIAYIVAKSIGWHQDHMKEMFGNCEILARRGYKIAKSTKTR